MNKRKLSFNAIDAVLVLILAAIIFVLLYIFVFSEKQDQTADIQTKPIQYTILIQNIDEHCSDYFSQGLPVTDAIEKKSIGKIAGVQVSPMVMNVINYETEQETQSSVEGKINVRVTIEGQAAETDQAFQIDGCTIRVGKQYSLMLPEIYAVGYCIDINDKLQN